MIVVFWCEEYFFGVMKSNQRQSGYYQKGLFKEDQFSTSNYGEYVAFGEKSTDLA